MDSLTRVLATFFGSGRFPFAPATFASLVVTVLAWFLLPPLAPVWIAAALVATVIGVPIATRAEKLWGHDAKPIVIDEVAGMLITLLALPKLLWVYAAGFLLFRIFDIVKPFPAGRAQALPRGYGVVADDLVAGVYAYLILRLMLVLWG